MLKGKKISRRLRRRKKTLYTLILTFYCSFKKQFFERIRKKFSKLYMTQFWLFIAFLRNNFPEKLPKFSKTAPSAPNFGRFAPKILPPQPPILWGDRLTSSRRLMGGAAPPPNIRLIVLNLSPQYFGDWGGKILGAKRLNSAPKAPI